MNYKIEKNIPLVEHGLSGSWSRLAKEMQVGDSVLIETRHKATNIANHLRNLGYKPVTRAVDGGVRVWKMEKKNADE
jgi:hypothetical protein